MGALSRFVLLCPLPKMLLNFNKKKKKMNTLYLNCIIKKLQVVARQLPMAMILLIQFSD